MTYPFKKGSIVTSKVTGNAYHVIDNNGNAIRMIQVTNADEWELFSCPADQIQAETAKKYEDAVRKLLAYLKDREKTCDEVYMQTDDDFANGQCESFAESQEEIIKAIRTVNPDFKE